MYLTEQQIDAAVARGYAVTISRERGSSARIEQGGITRCVWMIRKAAVDPMASGQIAWQTADLVDNFYTNHVAFDDFIDALNRPIGDNANG
jgi:hypothetical protein